MSNPWFRLYSEFANDPKIQRMSEADQRRFVMLLCMKCSNGDVTLQNEDVAFQLRISNAEWQESKSIFLSKNLIDVRDAYEQTEQQASLMFGADQPTNCEAA